MLLTDTHRAGKDGEVQTADCETRSIRMMPLPDDARRPISPTSKRQELSINQYIPLHFRSAVANCQQWEPGRTLMLT